MKQIIEIPSTITVLTGYIDRPKELPGSMITTELIGKRLNGNLVLNVYWLGERETIPHINHNVNPCGRLCSLKDKREIERQNVLVIVAGTFSRAGTYKYAILDAVLSVSTVHVSGLISNEDDEAKKWRQMDYRLYVGRYIVDPGPEGYCQVCNGHGQRWITSRVSGGSNVIDCRACDGTGLEINNGVKT